MGDHIELREPTKNQESDDALYHLIHDSKGVGPQEALKQISLERHNYDELLDIINLNDFNIAVDLVPGCHFDLFFTEQELKEAKADFESAKAEGANLDDVEWHDKEEVEKVRKFGEFRVNSLGIDGIYRNMDRRIQR